MCVCARMCVHNTHVLYRSPSNRALSDHRASCTYLWLNEVQTQSTSSPHLSSALVLTEERSQTSWLNHRSCSLLALSLLTSRGLGSFRVTISRTARAKGSRWLQMAKTWAQGSPILESLTDTFGLREEVILSIFSLFLHEVYTRW